MIVSAMQTFERFVDSLVTPSPTTKPAALRTTNDQLIEKSKSIFNDSLGPCWLVVSDATLDIIETFSERREALRFAKRNPSFRIVGNF